MAFQPNYKVDAMITRLKQLLDAPGEVGDARLMAIPLWFIGQITDEQIEGMLALQGAPLMFPAEPPAGHTCPACDTWGIETLHNEATGRTDHATCRTCGGQGKLNDSEMLSLVTQERDELAKRIEMAGGYHERTKKEAAIAEAASIMAASRNEGSLDKLDRTWKMVDYLLEIVDAGRNRVHEEVEKREAAEAEVERLNGLLSADPEVIDASFRTGKVEARVNHWAAKVLAHAFWKHLEEMNAENFISLQFTTPTGQGLIVTVQREGKKSPVEAINEMKTENDRLRDALRKIADCDVTVEGVAGGLPEVALYALENGKAYSRAKDLEDQLAAARDHISQLENYLAELLEVQE